MISPSDRALAVELIQEANQNGARLAKACEELNISVRTYERWVAESGVKEDQRPLAKRPEPKNKLTLEERQEIIEVAKKVPVQENGNMISGWDRLKEDTTIRIIIILRIM
jgi:putative transposase